MDFTHDEKVKDKFNRMGSLLLRAQKTYERNDFLKLRRLLNRIKRNTYRLEDIVESAIIRQMCIKNYGELTHKNIEALDTINEHLRTLEQKICKEAENHAKHAEHRLTSQGDNNLDCFHIDIDISYHIGEDDPAYLDDSDNSIAIEKNYCYPDPGDFDHDENWNEYQFSSVHPLKNQNHCYLFHCLYDHLHLSWSDILRIRHVFAHFNAVYGHEIHLSTESLFSKGE